MESTPDAECETIILDFKSEEERALYDRVHAIRERTGKTMEATLRCRQVAADANVFLSSERSNGPFSSIPSDELATTTKASFINEFVTARKKSKFIIFCSWRREVENLYRVLEKRSCIRLTGKMVPSEQRDIIDLFDRENGPRILILTVSVGIAGLNLQTADHVILTSPQLDEFE